MSELSVAYLRSPPLKSRAVKISSPSNRIGIDARSIPNTVVYINVGKTVKFAEGIF